MADIDDVATEFESDEDMPDTIPNPRSLPFVPHVRVVTGQVSSKEQDRLDRERAEAEGMTPPSVLVRRA